ncbi:MAG: fumarylacetoacetate hydrolase family protein [Campylobacteraceae bacterium]|nr:fumarylacetoacetate hydrolase family protein [Campylobacteraceae bacterium]
MKLATLKNGTRDGSLVVVSRDLKTCIEVHSIAATLQDALDYWRFKEPLLKEIYEKLNNNDLEDIHDFHENQCESPLPRAYAWADGSAYLNHVELVRKARNAEVPKSFYSDPLMYQGGSDSFIGPKDDIELESLSWGVDFEGEVAIITDDVPMGISSSDAVHHIKLLMLVNDVSLRNLIPSELSKGFGFLHSKPSCSFSPICVTPDELGEAWENSKVNLALDVEYNENLFGNPNAANDMTFSFSDLLSHAAKTRTLCAGTIIGSGTVSNKLDGGAGKTIVDGGRGYSCIAEIRMIEIINEGEAKTPFMEFGDKVKISMSDKNGNSIFGSIEQTLVKYEKE